MIFTLDQIWQFVAWFLALVELGVALYILALNFWQSANRHVAVILLAATANTFAMGFLFTAKTTYDAELGFILRAMTTPISQIAMLIVSVVLVKPEWMRGRRRWGWWLLYGVALLPIALTAIDLTAKTQLWYSGPNEPFAGEGLSLSGFAHGSLSAPIRTLAIIVPSLCIPLILGLAIFDKKLARGARQLAVLLGIAVAVIAIVQVAIPKSVLGTNESTVLSNVILVTTFAYAGFQQMISERRLQRGGLQVRLTVLVLVGAVPLLIAVTLLLGNIASRELDVLSDRQLELSASGLKSNVQAWLKLNLQSVQELASLPEIVSMDPKLQKPALQAKAKAFPQLFLVQTTDLTGMNVARNDSGALQNYSDRKWFQGAKAGQPTIEVLISRTTGKPAMNMSAPIRDAAGNIIGVAAIVSQLDDISTQIAVNKVGETGVTYIVDSANRMVAHLDPNVVMKDSQLVDTTPFAPVARLRAEGRGYVPFTEQGVRWHAYVDRLENEPGKDWGIVIQQQESELQATLQVFRIAALIAVLAGALVLAGLVALTLRQAIQPVGTLTRVTAAIAAGDLARTAPVESEDELGALAEAFNSMTEQLRGLIGNLEQRVAERTLELETRSRYLEAAAQVGRAAASILDSAQLIQQVVELIRERFGLYYVGLFMVTQHEASQWAELRAGTGAAGQAMLARGHRLPVNEHSMIGWCIAHGQARVALQAGADAIRLATAELPNTRSEAALPLRSRGRVLGALTVQSDQPNAFDPTAIAALQTMADQVAVALDNARLFAESQTTLEAMRRTSAQLSREAWSGLITQRPRVGYLCDEHGVTEAGDLWRPEMEQARVSGTTQQGQAISGDGREVSRGIRHPLAVPIKVRGNVVAVLDTAKSGERSHWEPGEIALLETLADQLGAALESARLFEDTQRRAASEQLIGEVTARMRASLDLETVLNTALDEIHRAMGLDQVTIHLATGAAQPDSGFADNGRE